MGLPFHKKENKEIVQYTVEAIIEGIRNNDNTVLQYVYRKYFPKIKFFVLKNSGNDEEAKDVFQDAIILIYKKIINNSLSLDYSFQTYIYSVCRYIWLKQLKEKNKKPMNIFDEVDIVDLEDEIKDLYYETERFKLYQYHFNKLNKDCQKVLRLFLKKVSLEDIASEMGYSSGKYAKKRKYVCKEKLIKSIQNDSKYKIFKLTDEK